MWVVRIAEGMAAIGAAVFILLNLVAMVQRWRQARKWIVFWCLLGTASLAHAEILPSARILPWDAAGAKTDFATRVAGTPCQTLSPSGGDDTTAIQNALAACDGTDAASAGVVKLNAGTFRLDSMLSWNGLSWVSLVGAGPSQTTLFASSSMICAGSGTGQDGVINFATGGHAASFFDGTIRTVTATISKGATTLTTSVAHGWSVGDYVELSALNSGSSSSPPNWIASGMTWADGSYSGARIKMQVVRVTATGSSTTATFTPAAYWDYDSTPQARNVTGPIKGISIESLKIDNSTKLCRSHFSFYRVFDSRFYDLELVGMPATTGGHWVQLRSSAELTFGKLYIHNSNMYNTDGSYAFFCGPQVSSVLIEDNIMERTPIGIAPEGTCNGNVFAYNYFHDAQWFDTSVGRFGNAEHGAASGNLYEGNEAEGVTWCDGGNFAPVGSHLNVMFRNHLLRNPRIFHNSTTSHTLSGATDILALVDIEQNCHLWSLVGNVMTDDAYTSTRWQYISDVNYDGSTADCQTPDNTLFTIYKIGYVDAFPANCTGAEAQSAVTLIRYGNYTPVTAGGTPSTTGAAGITWDTRNISSDDRAFVNSYYLASKPAFFGSCTWPWIEPAGATAGDRVQVLPAKDRYNGTNLCANVATSSSVVMFIEQVGWHLLWPMAWWGVMKRESLTAYLSRLLLVQEALRARLTTSVRLATARMILLALAQVEARKHRRLH